MLALLVGASFAGLFGMLVIVPLVAVAKIVFLFMWSKYVDYGDELTQGDPGSASAHQGGDGLGPALADGVTTTGVPAAPSAAQAPLATRNMAPTTPPAGGRPGCRRWRPPRPSRPRPAR